MTSVRKVSVVTILAGAAGSIAFMMRAGRHQQSLILIVLFGIWVLSPFVGGLMVPSLSKRWSASTQRTLDILMAILALAALAIYGVVALEYLRAKAGFVFLMVPLASWLFIAAAAGGAALFSRRTRPGIISGQARPTNLR